MNFTKSNYGMDKLDKSTMLNPEMSIKPSQPDEYETKIKSIGGTN